MKYNDNFNVLLSTQWKSEYLGQGNPNSKILLINKEHGFNNPNQRELEIVHNWNQWNSDELEEGYHPRYCYRNRGQRFIQKPNNGGTSPTWMAFQKFINKVYPNAKINKNELLNFFDYCFISELSTCNRAMSDRRSEDTQQSINHRLKNANGILRQRFYQSFPIIILDCHHYIDANMYNIKIEQLFDQHFVECINLPNHEFINIHRNGNRMLLHTNHFSMRSDYFLQKVADLCKEHLDKIDSTL